jgi:cell division protein FtsB
MMNALHRLAETPVFSLPRHALRWLRDWLREDDGMWHDAPPRPLLLFLLIFGLGIILISLLGDQGLIAYHGLRREEAALRAEIAALQEEERKLAAEIEALRSDSQYIEMLARRRLGLVKPGETVLQLPRAASP